jgi:DNA recombination protein RmuC
LQKEFTGEEMSELPTILTLLLSAISLYFLFLIYKKINSQKGAETEEFIARIEKLVKDEMGRNREETSRSARDGRDELNKSLNFFGESSAKKMAELTQSNEQKFDKLQDKIEAQLRQISENNEQKLEQMRATVDEKLQSTLEKRLGESFKLVSDRLEAVREGLGEMRNLAVGVGDLKKVLTNVKTRGTWGEIQLENLMEQILTNDQYAKNIATKPGSSDRVEFAVKMPGRGGKEEICWLPIDAKFPMEDYQRLVSAQELGDIALIEESSKALENRIKLEAKTIYEKYIDPPNTTDVALLFLPVEGLFAEILRRPGLFEKIQNDYKVIITGPTTLTAILNSLQMGFRTLAIEKRSSEVWTILGTVKTEFGKFGEILDKTQKKLEEASKTIEDASKKTRTIQRKLRDVQDLPSDEIKLVEGEEE